MGCVVWGLRFGVWGLWFVVWGLWFVVCGLGCRVYGAWREVKGLGFRIQVHLHPVKERKGSRVLVMGRIQKVLAKHGQVESVWVGVQECTVIK